MWSNQPAHAVGRPSLLEQGSVRAEATGSAQLNQSSQPQTSQAEAIQPEQAAQSGEEAAQSGEAADLQEAKPAGKGKSRSTAGGRGGGKGRVRGQTKAAKSAAEKPAALPGESDEVSFCCSLKVCSRLYDGHSKCSHAMKNGAYPGTCSPDLMILHFWTQTNAHFVRNSPQSVTCWQAGQTALLLGAVAIVRPDTDGHAFAP